MNFSLLPSLAYLESGPWLQFVILGIVTGLILDLILKTKGLSYGFLGSTLLGLGGAILGTFIWDKFLNDHIKINIGQVTIQFNMVVVALLGAGLLLLIIKLIERGKKKA